jgi:hypothetical protein
MAQIHILFKTKCFPHFLLKSCELDTSESKKKKEEGKRLPFSLLVLLQLLD